MPNPITELVDEAGLAVGNVVFDATPPGQSQEAISTAEPVGVGTPAPEPVAAQPTIPGVADAGTVAAAPAAGAANNTPAAGGSEGLPAEGATAPPSPWYQQLGLPEQFAKDEQTALQATRQALEEAIALNRQYEQERPWADFGRQAYQQRQAPAPGAAAPEPTAVAPPAPTIPWTKVDPDPMWERYRDPATGNYHPDKMPAPMAETFYRYVDGLRKAQETMYRDPNSVIAPAVEQAIRPLQERIDQLTKHLEQQPRDQEARAFLQEHQSWMLTASPLTGKPTLSPSGEAFYNIYQEAQRNGAPELVARNLALQTVSNAALQFRLQQLAQPAAGGAGVPAPAAVDPKAALLATNPGAAVRQASRAGSVVAATPANPQFRSAGDAQDQVTARIHAALAAHGVTDESNQLTYANPSV